MPTTRPAHLTKETARHFPWVADPKDIRCPHCEDNRHLIVFWGCKDYKTLCLDVLEVNCLRHQICLAVYTVGQDMVEDWSA